jgi:hypothetical protein
MKELHMSGRVAAIQEHLIGFIMDEIVNAREEFYFDWSHIENIYYK